MNEIASFQVKFNPDEEPFYTLTKNLKYKKFFIKECLSKLLEDEEKLRVFIQDASKLEEIKKLKGE